MNFAEVEPLVQQFYGLGQPQQKKVIEERLQLLQSSEQGWQLADTLLLSGDRNVRFFGALTFTVKIKRDGASLTANDAASLLDRLLQHLIRLTDKGESALVVQKLCNALISFHSSPSYAWERPVVSVMVALAQGQGLATDGLPVFEITRKLGHHQTLAALWFAASLAEEAKLAFAVSAQSHRYHEHVASNVDDVASLLRASMELPSKGDKEKNKLVREGLKCFQSWVMFVQRAWMENNLQLSPLQDLTPQAVQALSYEELFEESCDLLIEILENFPTFLTAEHSASVATLLVQPTISRKLLDLVAGDNDPEAALLARLCLVYGEAYVQDLARRDDSASELILDQLLHLLNHTGFPGVEDEGYCSQALAFWQTYLEFITDSLYTIEPDQKPPWMRVATQRVLKVLEICWSKLRQPTNDEASRWNSDERMSFQAYCNDVQDFLQSSYTLLGISNFERFAWLATKSIGERAWLELEASLICLNALSEAVSEEPNLDDMLSKVFDSALFSDMATHRVEIPAKTKQLAITMVTKFIGFFERHSDYLPAMLNYLFRSLDNSALTSVAAKAISVACSSCRTTLVPELATLIRHYENIQSQTNLDGNTKEKVLYGITAIIQAFSTDDLKVDPLRRLLSLIGSDVRTCLAAMTGPHVEASGTETFQTHGVSALRCLASMGKALQMPADLAIDLDAEFSTNVIWTTGQGAALQGVIINIVHNITSLMPWNSEITEAACHILRTGYKETAHGLFVFHPEVTVSFLRSASLQTSRLDLIIYTTTAMLIQSSSSPSDMPEAALMCLTHAVKLLSDLNYDPSTEPEVAASILDLADKCVPRYLLSMSQLPEIDQVFEFALACLASAEIMPSRSAAEFWSKFVQRYELDSEEATDFQASALQKCGPKLCQILIHGIAGEVPRSSLDSLAEPLRKIIFAQPQTKQWLTAALTHPDFPSDKINQTRKRIWLDKIMSLRGSRKTKNEVKDFWVACRGPESNFAF